MSVRFIFSAVSLLMLTACSALKPDTANELIRAQQQEAAHIQRQEHERAEQAAKNQPQLLLTLIDEHINQQRYFAALAYINSYVHHFGSTPALAIRHGHVLRNLDQDEDAQRVYEQALKSDHKAQALHGLGLLAAKRQRFDLATAFLEQATALNPTDATALSDLGFAYLSLGQTHKARMPLGQATELAPTDQRITANVALLLFMERDEQGAQRLMQAAGLDPASQTHIQQLAHQLAAPPPVPQRPTRVEQASGRPAPSVPSSSPHLPTDLPTALPTGTRHIPLTAPRF